MAQVECNAIIIGLPFTVPRPFHLFSSNRLPCLLLANLVSQLLSRHLSFLHVLESTEHVVQTTLLLDRVRLDTVLFNKLGTDIRCEPDHKIEIGLVRLQCLTGDKIELMTRDQRVRELVLDLDALFLGEFLSVLGRWEQQVELTTGFVKRLQANLGTFLLSNAIERLFKRSVRDFLDLFRALVSALTVIHNGVRSILLDERMVVLGRRRNDLVTGQFRQLDRKESNRRRSTVDEVPVLSRDLLRWVRHRLPIVEHLSGREESNTVLRCGLVTQRGRDAENAGRVGFQVFSVGTAVLEFAALPFRYEGIGREEIDEVESKFKTKGKRG